MAIDIKPNRLNLNCRTCLEERSAERYIISELPETLYQLLLQCLETDSLQPFFPDSICQECYNILKGFDDFQMLTKKSNIILQDFFRTNKSCGADELETDDKSMRSTDKLEDPLNCSNTDIKGESLATEGHGNIENYTNIVTEIVKVEPDDEVFFSTADNAEEIICKYGCGKTFQRISSLKSHYRMEHIRINCLHKKDTNTEHSNLEKEEWIDSPKPKVKNKPTCDICKREYADMSTLRVHKRLHWDKLPFQCEKCDRSFNKKVRLTKHFNEQHTSETLQLICKYGCGKIFERYRALERHHHKHRFNKLEESSSCTLKSKQEKETRVQQRSKESRTQDACICEDCGQVLPNISKLREHSFKHRPPQERPFKCEHCAKTFIIKRSYAEHLNRHAGVKNFECHVCGWKAATQRQVVKHMNIHTKESQVSCVICSKVYADPKTLKRHIETVHQGLKKYNCRYCDKTFAKSDVRNRHETEHGAEAPYKCKLCNESFYLISKLSSHISSVHNTITTTTSTQQSLNASHDEHNNSFC